MHAKFQDNNFRGSEFTEVGQNLAFSTDFAHASYLTHCSATALHTSNTKARNTDRDTDLHAAYLRAPLEPDSCLSSNSTMFRLRLNTKLPTIREQPPE